MEDEDEDEDFGHPFKHQLFNKESLLSMEVIETESFEKLPLILPVKETIPITIPEGIFDSTGPQVYKMPYKYKGKSLDIYDQIIIIFIDYRRCHNGAI